MLPVLVDLGADLTRLAALRCLQVESVSNRDL